MVAIIRPVFSLSLFATVLMCSASAHAGSSLAGKWEVQSMGADRSVSMQQKGNRITAHRVLWPEFEGEKYKLEHLYRGRIHGNKIRGQLLVREEELPDFEVLREFVGSVDSDAVITLDGLPMKRVGKEAPNSPAAPKGPKGRVPDMPGFGSAIPAPSEVPSPLAPAPTQQRREALAVHKLTKVETGLERSL